MSSPGGVTNADAKGEPLGPDGAVEGMDSAGEFCSLAVLEDVGEGRLLAKRSKEESLRESFLTHILRREDSTVSNLEWFLHG